MERVDVAIVGAGAAGLFAAIFAGRSSGAGARVVALDGAKKIGAKILISGGGRCNVTHDVVHPDDYFGSNRNLIARVLRSFTVEQTIAFFAEYGIRLKREDTGKLFPTTDRAKDVVDALLHAAADAGAEVRTNARVTAVERQGDSFTLSVGPSRIDARRVILATGGLSVPKTGSDGFGYELARRLGHTVTVTTPALVPLVLPNGHWMTALSGVSVDVELRVVAGSGKVVRRDRGSMLFTHFGLSGPVVLDISRHWIASGSGAAAGGALAAPAGRLYADFLVGSFEEVEQMLQREVRERPRAAIKTIIGRALPERVAIALLESGAAVDPEKMLGQLTREERRAVAHAVTSLEIPVERDRGYPFAEVTAGGVPLSEMNVATMESKITPGLFLCGEIVDVDGRIGGYNFQWAWASGRLAGMHAAEASAPP